MQPGNRSRGQKVVVQQTVLQKKLPLPRVDRLCNSQASGPNKKTKKKFDTDRPSLAHRERFLRRWVHLPPLPTCSSCIELCMFMSFTVLLDVLPGRLRLPGGGGFCRIKHVKEWHHPLLFSSTLSEAKSPSEIPTLSVSRTKGFRHGFWQ